jgi:broad specificity phosphatase PhoE
MTSKAGTITLARHGEPALSRKVRLNPREYGEFWGKYEVGGLVEGQKAPDFLVQWAKEADVVWVSTRRRAIESATILLGEGAETIVDARLIEAPLPPPPWPAFVRMTPKVWGFWARFWWWWFNHHDGQETKAQATLRARAVIADIIRSAEEGKNVLVVAHGFFNAMMGLELKRAGWKKVQGRGWKYWSTRRFERR